MTVYRQLFTIGLLALGARALPQASSADAVSATSTTSTSAALASGTGVSPSQSTAFSQAVGAYITSLEQSPQITAIGIALAIADSNALQALKADPAQLLPSGVTGTDVDLRSLATAPPLSFSSLSIYSNLDAQLISSIQALQTSAVVQIASIDQSVLSTTASINTGAPTSSSSSGGVGHGVAKPTGLTALGAAVGAFGAAVALL